MTDEQTIRRKVREINDYLFAGKPVYWDRPAPGGQNGHKRFRVFRARLSKGKFQIMPLAGRKWLDAGITDNFEFSG